MNFVPLIKSTINTINSKKSLTPSTRQQALRFYFYCEDNVGDADEESKRAIKEYYNFLKEKGIITR